MMLFPGYRKCSFLEQTVARRFDDLQHRIDALQGLLNSYFDYVNPELFVMRRGCRPKDKEVE